MIDVFCSAILASTGPIERFWIFHVVIGAAVTAGSWAILSRLVCGATMRAWVRAGCMWQFVVIAGTLFLAWIPRLIYELIVRDPILAIWDLIASAALGGLWIAGSCVAAARCARMVIRSDEGATRRERIIRSTVLAGLLSAAWIIPYIQRSTLDWAVWPRGVETFIGDPSLASYELVCVDSINGLVVLIDLGTGTKRPTGVSVSAPGNFLVIHPLSQAGRAVYAESLIPQPPPEMGFFPEEWDEVALIVLEGDALPRVAGSGYYARHQVDPGRDPFIDASDVPWQNFRVFRTNKTETFGFEVPFFSRFRLLGRIRTASGRIASEYRWKMNSVIPLNDRFVIVGLGNRHTLLLDLDARIVRYLSRVYSPQVVKRLSEVQVE